MHAVHDDVYANVLRLRFAIGLLDIANMEISPKQICARHRNGNEVAPIDGDPRTLCRGGFTFVFFVPLAETNIPQS